MSDITAPSPSPDNVRIGRFARRALTFVGVDPDRLTSVSAKAYHLGIFFAIFVGAGATTTLVVLAMTSHGAAA